ncbi:leucine-rich repeat domain-containing protein [Paenibacillus sp. TC-CSREp1]|uniref:leucine-rich repeat domain-containing protein n=1 Tax=Paenibacillus sp. TC-CSREp1 TaxID=3410089 RepID=UPI003D0162E4
MGIRLESFERDNKRMEAYFDGESEYWEPPVFVTQRKGNKSDCMEYSITFLVFSKRAKEVLAPLIGKDVEFLPLIHADQEMFAVKVNRIQDFIDRSNPVERKIGYGFFSEYVHILPERIEADAHLFCLPQHHHLRFFATDTFKKVVEENKLKTFEFIELWDTENTEEMRKERLKTYDTYYAGIEARRQVSYETARSNVELGNICRHDDHILMQNGDQFLIGKILDNESIQWIGPKYIPPIFLGWQWYVYESSELARVQQEYFAEVSYKVNGPKGNKVFFKDEHLEQGIRSELQVFKEDLTDMNLLELRNIFRHYIKGPVYHLDGIQYAKNLQGYSVEENPDFDLAELRYLPESVASLCINNMELSSMSDLNRLTHLSNLELIHIENNNLVDLSPLQTFPHLHWIRADYNQIQDITPLNQLTNLRDLILSHNPIKNIHLLELPELRNLHIEGVFTEDWGFLLTQFPKLESVWISESGMSEASRKSIRAVIKSKKFEIEWILAGGGSRRYNRKR